MLNYHQKKATEVKYDQFQNYLNYVYIGNVANLNQNIYCPDCQELLIERNLYESKVFLTEPKCPTCGAKIEMILT